MRGFYMYVSACALGLSIVGCASTPQQSSLGENIDDSVITTKVKALFVKDKEVEGRDISVTTTKGVVELKGQVQSQADVDQAVDITRKVSGVKSVVNHLTVK